MMASGALLLRRSAVTYASAIAAIGFFVALAACYGELMTTGGIAFVVPGVLAITGAQLWLDVRKGMKAQHAVDRMAVGLLTAVGVLYLAGVLVINGLVDRRAENPMMVALICLFPLFVALGGSLRQPQGHAWLVETLVTAVGGVGWLLVLRRAVLVGAMVALGPSSVQGAWDLPSWIPERLVDDVWGYLLTPLALPFAAFTALRIRRRCGPTVGVIAGEILFGVLLLGWAYRLAALVALSGLVLYRVITRAAVVEWWVYAAIVAISILPVDVSLQRGGTNGHRFLPGRGGDYTADALRNPPAYGFVMVGEGFYYSPRFVWVW
jgi:hypothetical protein